jgi:hypothetical protein
MQGCKPVIASLHFPSIHENHNVVFLRSTRIIMSQYLLATLYLIVVSLELPVCHILVWVRAHVCVEVGVLVSVCFEGIKNDQTKSQKMRLLTILSLSLSLSLSFSLSFSLSLSLSLANTHRHSHRHTDTDTVTGTQTQTQTLRHTMTERCPS